MPIQEVLLKGFLGFAGGYLIGKLIRNLAVMTIFDFLLVIGAVLIASAITYYVTHS